MTFTHLVIGVPSLTDTHIESTLSSTVITNGSTQEKPSTIEVLKNKTFMLLFAAQFTQNIGAAVSMLALQFLILKLTDSAGIMGIFLIVFWLPFVLFTPITGVFVDRFDQRKIMLIANLLSFTASLGYVLVYVLYDNLNIITNTIHVIWPMFVLTFLNSTASSLFFPSRSAYTRLIVKKKNLLIANSIGSTVYQIATIVGYVLAGVIAGRSYLGSFIFDASTFAFSLTMIIFILFVGKKPPKVIRHKEESFRTQMKGVYDDFRIGFRTIRNAPKITYMLIVFSAAIFSFSAFSVLFVIKVQNQYLMNLDETWYGVLQSLMGISGIITSLLLMNIGKIKRKVVLLNIALVGATAFLYFFAFINNKYGIGFLLFIFGITLSMINVSAPTLIQEQIPYEKQGRVFGTQQLFQGIARITGMGLVSIIAGFFQDEKIVNIKYILLAGSILLTIVMIWGIIYSTVSGISGDDYKDLNGKKLEESIIVKKTTDIEDSYGIIDPEPASE
jgi:MFS family permease